MRIMDRITADRIKSGDVEAYEDLITHYQSRVFSYCLRMTGNFHDAEELAQDVFVKVFRHIDQYDSGKGALSTWIFRIAHNNCANHLRNQGVRRDKPGLEEMLHSLPEPGDPYRRVDQQADLASALAGLETADRELVLMKDYLDLKVSEIAQILDIPSGTVKSRLHTARARLKSLILDGDQL